ncbi:MAG: SusD/RagB family nutrient-binding outer membrane lipoprotein [Chitinophagaceae bacterium]|nr:SusD/RagB family nutrient-binding outer membrane lipoprotein [Chitinophagaceae bacterium]MCW5927113.1 SusD/RagB family nutrient-binding outer membrane lipoprotein [Chitinophagaceae bacterium]
MKRILSFILIVVIASSCTKGLQELNINKTSPISVNPTFLLNSALLNTSFIGRTVTIDMGVVQQIVSPNGGVLAGANFNQDNRDNTLGSIWQTYYQNVVKYTHDIISTTRENPDRTNLYNMARILRAYAYMVLTDGYGDIPYFQGGAGYTDQIFLPVYDKQDAIYNDIIKELTEAAAALDAAKAIETADLLYSGNIAGWKKFAYSALLRAGMRLSKADAAKAQATVQAAFAGGVILANEDNAYIRHDVSFPLPIGNMLNSTEAANFYLAKPFIDYLKNNNDPRLSAIAIRYKGATSGPAQTVAISTSAAADQIGMPMGFDNATIVAQAAADGLASFYDYSQADRRRIAKTTSPNFFITASQTKLLLAEARFRNWITTGTAEGYFSEGVAAHMDQMAQYDAGSAISTGNRDAYITAHPLEAGKELEQINTQYWISSFLNGPEAFANFRRSGFPLLTPNPYGQPNNPDVPNGTFIRRLTYPTSELSINTENVNTAIATQGEDKLSTRIWWDKP